MQGFFSYNILPCPSANGVDDETIEKSNEFGKKASDFMDEAGNDAQLFAKEAGNTLEELSEKGSVELENAIKTFNGTFSDINKNNIGNI